MKTIPLVLTLLAALTLGADRIATGHYAQVREWTNDGRTEFQLLKAEDGTKDQSYFLYRLNQAQLSKTLFPLGGLYKREVRKMAEAGQLSSETVINALKGQAQGAGHAGWNREKGVFQARQPEYI